VRPQIRAILFDLDGTIFGSVGERAPDIFFKVAKKLELPVEKEQKELVKKLWGVSSKELVEECWPEMDFEVFYREWIELESLPENLPPLIQGVPYSLKFFRGYGATLGIFTNRCIEDTSKVLERHDISDFFPIVYTSDNLLPSQGKGDQKSVDIVLRDLSEKGFGKDSVIFVGDSDIDLQWAKWAEMQFIAVLSGNMTHEEFCAAGQPEKLIFKSIASLPIAIPYLELGLLK